MSCPIVPIEREPLRQSTDGQRKPTLTGVVSLLDMLRDNADAYLTIGRLFEHMMYGYEAAMLRNRPLSQKHFNDLIEQLTQLQAKCAEIGMDISADIVGQAIQHFIQFQPSVTYVLVQIRAGEMFRSFSAELRNQAFYRLLPDRAKFFVPTVPDDKYNPIFGTDVETKFTDAIYDINEAGRCLATERNTACVLHLMRVLEIGLQSLAAKFAVSFDHKNWENIIAETEKAIGQISKAPTKPANWKADEERYSDIAKEFRYLKNAWRNHVMHIRHKYDFEEALGVFRHVCEFMQHLAAVV